MKSVQHREAWNKGKLVGQKPPLKPKDIWAIRYQLQNAHQVRDLAMFNPAIDSNWRGYDLVKLHVRDIMHGNRILPRAIVAQQKTQHPVQFERTEPTRTAVSAWMFEASCSRCPCGGFLAETDYQIPDQGATRDSSHNPPAKATPQSGSRQT